MAHTIVAEKLKERRARPAGAAEHRHLPHARFLPGERDPARRGAREGGGEGEARQIAGRMTALVPNSLRRSFPRKHRSTGERAMTSRTPTDGNRSTAIRRDRSHGSRRRAGRRRVDRTEAVRRQVTVMRSQFQKSRADGRPADMADVERDTIESSRGELATARMRHRAARRWCDFATGPPQCRRAAA